MELKSNALAKCELHAKSKSCGRWHQPTLMVYSPQSVLVQAQRIVDIHPNTMSLPPIARRQANGEWPKCGGVIGNK